MEETNSQESDGDVKQESDGSYCLVSPEEDYLTDMDTNTNTTSSLEQTSKGGVIVPASDKGEPGNDIREANQLRNLKTDTEADQAGGTIVRSILSDFRIAIDATSTRENSVSGQFNWDRIVVCGSPGQFSLQFTEVDPTRSESDVVSGREIAAISGYPVDSLTCRAGSGSTVPGGRKVNTKIRISPSLSSVVLSARGSRNASMNEGAVCEKDAVIIKRQNSTKPSDTFTTSPSTGRASSDYENGNPPCPLLAKLRQ